MNIAEMRDLLGESRASFSKRYNIPVRTLENWESGKTHCPKYVLELLEKTVKNDAKKIVKNKIEYPIVFEGTHYGVKVTCVSAYNSNAFKAAINFLEQKGYQFTVLPIYPKEGTDYTYNMYVDVIKYIKDGDTWYAITCLQTEAYYLTESLPYDMDLNALIDDMQNQYLGKKEPEKLKSKFNVLFNDAFSIAINVISGEVYKRGLSIPYCYAKLIKEYDMERAREFGGKYGYNEYGFYSQECENIVKMYPDLFYDTHIVHIFIIMAKLLYEKGYEYSDMETYAKLCDDVDDSTKENDLKCLEIGYNWRYYRDNTTNGGKL